jgi:transcriptional regulator with XRE-family HTH domain
MELLSAGHRLRQIREQLGLTIRDVEAASTRLGAKYQNDDYSISLSRLSDIETKGVLPNIYRVYSLAVIYRRTITEVLSLYGIDLNQVVDDLVQISPPKSHLLESLKNIETANLPVRLDPSFDLRRTANLGRMIERWGVVPLAFLSRFAESNYTYGYIGTEDWTMYPLLLPGSFVQIDEAQNKVREELWRSEYERPIYFVETREGYFCGWCSARGETLFLQPHPLSPAAVRTFRHPQEAEVVGQVVGVAMQLRDVGVPQRQPSSAGRSKLI